MLAEEDSDVFFIPAHLVEFFGDGGEHVLGDFGRVLRFLQLRIGIAARQVDGIGHELQECFAQFLERRRAETNRIRHAFAFGDAVVGVVRRQVQHVARLQHEFFFGLEIGEDLERQAVDDRQVLLRTDAPATLAVRLQQEHVVRIIMGTDAGAIGGKAHHQVVQAGIGHEAELAQQVVGALVMQVHALDQHRPVRRAACRQVGQGAVLHVPLAVAQRHQARFDVVQRGQLGQLLELEQRLEAGDGATDQQRLLVPVIAQEFSGGKIPQKR